MLVEVHEVQFAKAVEVVEEGEFGFVLGPVGGVAEGLDKDPWVDLFLDVEGRSITLQELGQVLFLLAAPGKLRAV